MCAEVSPPCRVNNANSRDNVGVLCVLSIQIQLWCSSCERNITCLEPQVWHSNMNQQLFVPSRSRKMEKVVDLRRHFCRIVSLRVWAARAATYAAVLFSI